MYAVNDDSVNERGTFPQKERANITITIEDDTIHVSDGDEVVYFDNSNDDDVHVIAVANADDDNIIIVVVMISWHCFEHWLFVI